MLFKTLAEASGVFVAVTFVGGWFYLASYYTTFGINPLELDIPIPLVCTYALYLGYKSVWFLVVTAMLVLATVTGVRYLRTLRREIMLLAFLLTFLASAVAADILGRAAAHRDMVDTSSRLPNVAFAAKENEGGEKSCVGYKQYGSSDCKLLLHLKNTYHFFEPLRLDETKAAAVVQGNIRVSTITDSEIVGVEVQRGLAIR